VPSLFEELEKNELKGNKYLKTNPFSIELIYHKPDKLQFIKVENIYVNSLDSISSSSP
jgi:hypothetical protein